MDMNSLSLTEIEQHLNIRPYDHEFFKGERGISEKILDTWQEVVEFIRNQKAQDSMYTSFHVLGYELIQDNHYIKIYHKTNVYFT